jgi:hypothetical protein
MKAKFLLVILALALGCSEDDDSNSFKKKVINTVSEGTWRITYYFDSDTDETSDYAGYNFTFADSDVLTTTNGVNTYTGAWSVTDSNSNDDTLDDLDFNILFTTPLLFEELSDDWTIVELTDTTIELIDVSGGGGGTDYLTFEKN